MLFSTKTMLCCADDFNILGPNNHDYSSVLTRLDKDCER